MFSYFSFKTVEDKLISQELITENSEKRMKEDESNSTLTASGSTYTNNLTLNESLISRTGSTYSRHECSKENVISGTGSRYSRHERSKETVISRTGSSYASREHLQESVTSRTASTYSRHEHPEEGVASRTGSPFSSHDRLKENVISRTNSANPNVSVVERNGEDALVSGSNGRVNGSQILFQSPKSHKNKQFTEAITSLTDTVLAAVFISIWLFGMIFLVCTLLCCTNQAIASFNGVVIAKDGLPTKIYHYMYGKPEPTWSEYVSLNVHLMLEHIKSVCFKTPPPPPTLSARVARYFQDLLDQAYGITSA